MSEELYKRYYNDLLKWSLIKTKSFSDAEDLVQEIYYQLIKAINKDIIIINEERFIWKLAYYTWCNKVKDYILNKKISNLDDFENIIIDNRENIIKKVETIEIKEILNKYIDKLNDLTKNCLKLYYYEEYSINEISSKLNINNNLVKYYLFKGRNKLKGELKNIVKEFMIKNYKDNSFIH